MAYIDFVGKIHNATKRDYRERVCVHDKVACAEKAVQFGFDYWDGDRSTGYGGYRYDGRWRAVAEDMARHYALASPEEAEEYDRQYQERLARRRQIAQKRK